MKTIFVILILATVIPATGAWAKDPTLTKEVISVGSATYTNLTKIVDSEEKRVCYAVTNGSSGGSSLTCYDRKAGSSAKESEKDSDEK